ncbi:MAG: DUF4919 domain-containing protein [Myxococcota bacterium]|nr:DUF4919 domain-containing protein [Myxococcales bacterium]
MAAIALLAAACASDRAGGPGAERLRYADSRTDWSRPVDFGELRREYGERDDFARRCEEGQPIAAAAAAFAQQQWSEVLAVATPFLDRCPVDMDFHYLRSVALSSLGREAESMQHQHWRHGLLESVLRSGDGASAASPWVVISVGEEYAVLRALGLERESQALVEGGVDALSVSDEDGARSVVYFAPRAHFARLRRALERAAP